MSSSLEKSNRKIAGCRRVLWNRMALPAAVLYLAMGALRALADNFNAPSPPDAGERTRFREAAKTAMAGGNFKEAGADYRAAWAASEGFGVRDPRYRESLHELAQYSVSAGKPDLAEKLYRKGVDEAQAAHRETYPEGGEMKYYLAHVCFLRGNFAEAEKFFLEARKVMGIANGAYDTSVGACLGGLAQVYTAQGKYSDAEPLFRKAIAIYANPKVTMQFKNVGGMKPQAMTWRFTPSPHVLAEEWRLLALMFTKAGDFAKAETACHDSMKGISKNLGAESADMAMAKVALAEVYIREKKYDEAETELKKSVEMIGAKYGPDSIYSLDALIKLADLGRAQKKYAEAEVCLRRAFDTIKAGSRPSGMLSYAIFNSTSGRMDDAESLLSLTLDIEEKVLADDPMELAPYLINAARAKYAWSRFRESAALYERGIGLIEKKAGANDPRLPALRNEFEAVRRETTL